MTSSGISITAAAFALSLIAAPSFAHDFWINNGHYRSPGDNSHCCGANDCFMVPASDMRPTGRGWLIRSLGETIPYSEAQTSEDGAFWRCKRHDGSRRCFFAPQPST